MGIRDKVRNILNRDKKSPPSSGNNNLQSSEPAPQSREGGAVLVNPRTGESVGSTSPELYSGRGGGSSGGSNEPNMSEQPNQTYASSSDLGGKAPEVSQSVLRQQQRIENQRQQRFETERQKTRDILIRSSGGVQIGNSKYVGDIIVPGTGMTANEYRRYVQQQALNEGLITKEDISSGRLEFNISRGGKPKPNQSKASDSDLGILSQDKYKDIKVDTKNLYFPGDKFVKSSGDIYGQGTGVPESITLEERRKRESAKFKGDLFSIPISEITSKSKKYEELSKDLDKLEGSKLDIRLQQLRDVGADIKEIKTKEGTSFEILEPKVGIGFGSNKREISISDLDTRRNTRVLASGIGLEVGEKVRRGVSALGLTEEGIFRIPSSRQNYIEPVFGTAQIDPMTGRAITSIKRQVTIPSQPIVTPSQLGGIATFTTRAGLFFPEEAGTIVETASSKRNLGAGLITYAKESPMEVATLATLGALKGASVLARPVIKTEGNIIRLTTKGDELFGKSIKVSMPKKNIIRLETTPSVRGIVIKRNPIYINSQLEAVESIGKNIKIVKGNKIKESVLFPEQQIVESKIAGSYVTVEKPVGSQGLFGYRVSINKEGAKILPPKMEKIYSGNPFSKSGKIERKKVLKFLEDKGLNKEISKDIIRLNQPIKIEQTTSGKLNIIGKKSLGQFEFVTNQPKILIDENLGIKTRGAKPIKDIVYVDRSLGTFNGKEVTLELKTKIRKGFEKGIERMDSGEVSLGIIKGKSFDTGDMFLPRNLNRLNKGDIIVNEKLPTQTIYGLSGERKLLGISFKNEKDVIDETLIKPSKTILFKQEINLDKDIGGKIVGGKKTPLSKTFQEQISDTEQLLREGVLPEKIDIVKTSSTSNKNIILSTKSDIPQMSSVFAGKGLYELTSGGIIISSEQSTSSVQPQSVKTDFLTGSVISKPQDTKQDLISTSREQTNQISTQTTIQSPKSELKPKQESISVSLTKLSSGSRNITNTITQTKQDSKQSNVLRSATVQVSKSKQKLDLLAKSISQLSPRTTTTKTTIPKIPKIKLPTPQTPKEKSVAKQKVEDIFKAFGRVKGQDVELGEFKTQVSAERELKTFLKTTLGASGKVKKGEEELEFSELGLFGGGEFRQSKVSPFRVVQKRERRLSTGQETSQIQFFKKQKGTKTRFL